MEYKQGFVYLADLNPKRKDTEVGKVRPVLIVQTDMLNDVVHPSTIIIPLTSNTQNGFKLLRYRISKREGLEKNSDLLIDQIRSIDNTRFQSESICCLSDKELDDVLSMILNVMKKSS